MGMRRPDGLVWPGDEAAHPWEPSNMQLRVH